MIPVDKRDKYVNALEKVCVNKNISLFIEYFFEVVIL